MQNHSRTAVDDPTPDERTQQNIKKQPAEHARIGHRADHVFGLIRDRQNVERDDQRDDNYKGITLRLVEGNDIISDPLRTRGTLSGGLHKEIK